MSRFLTDLPLRTWVRLAGPWLDARLAAGDDPAADCALRCRSAELVRRRSRQRTARGLERVLSARSNSAGLSAVISCDWAAVEIARPALEQLSRALLVRQSVQSRGVALTRVLLSDPCSALYRPAYPEQLYEVARGALLALSRSEPASVADPVGR